jgi:sugar diacid utilization regulator
VSDQQALAGPDQDALRTLAHRIALGKHELARTIVARIRTDIVSYALLEGEPEYDEAVAYASENIDALLAALTSPDPSPPGPLLQHTRHTAQQLVSRGVSLSAIHHAGRVWGATVWDAVLAAARPDHPQEREAALHIASQIWRHVDITSTTAALAYLDEVTDRGLLGRQLMDTLLAGRGDTEFADRLAHSLHLHLGQHHVVVLIRGDGIPNEDTTQRPLATQITLDYIVDAARNHLRPTAGSLLLAIRLGDLVALYPVHGPNDLHQIRRDCQALTNNLNINVSIGISGAHHGLANIPTALTEARDAVEIAAGTDTHGRAVTLEDVLVDHMLRSSPHAQRILTNTLKPLTDYDQQHPADLLKTLNAYLTANTNLTKTARQLTVHPNTIVYRLHRIQDLTGHDPRTTDELLILYLALKLTQLKPNPNPDP